MFKDRTFDFGISESLEEVKPVVEEVEEDVDAAAHGAGGIEAVEVRGHLAREGNALGFAGLRHLVAGGIHDDAGVVVVLLHHLPKVVLPPVLQMQRVVVLGLVDVPHVHVFIHHQHAQPVAGFQQIGGCGIVGAADGIEAGIF